jgi:hypothetical protein
VSSPALSIILQNTCKAVWEGNGNFLVSLEMVAKFDTTVQEHARSITSEDIHNHYIGSFIQNGLILKTFLEKNKNCRKGKNYQIFFQLFLTVHPTWVIGNKCHLWADTQDVKVTEFYCPYCSSGGPGNGLLDYLLASIRNFGFHISNYRGPGFESGANMRAK